MSVGGSREVAEAVLGWVVKTKETMLAANTNLGRNIQSDDDLRRSRYAEYWYKFDHPVGWLVMCPSTPSQKCTSFRARLRAKKGTTPGQDFRGDFSSYRSSFDRIKNQGKNHNVVEGCRALLVWILQWTLESERVGDRQKLKDETTTRCSQPIRNGCRSDLDGRQDHQSHGSDSSACH